jgi:hypothetical protein
VVFQPFGWLLAVQKPNIRGPKTGYTGLSHLAAEKKYVNHQVILHIINIEGKDISNTNYQLTSDRFFKVLLTHEQGVHWRTVSYIMFVLPSAVVSPKAFNTFRIKGSSISSS